MSMSYAEIIKFEKTSGIPGISVSSTYRPGSVSNSGNADYHSKGEAVDFTGSPTALAQLAAWFKRFTPNLLEEIYSGPGATYVKNGQPVAASYYASELSGHKTHVHIAMSPSGVKAAEGSGGAAGAAVNAALPGGASLVGDVAGAAGAGLAAAVGPLVTGLKGIVFKLGFAGLGLGLVGIGLFVAVAPTLRTKVKQTQATLEEAL